jgi:regulatory protein YycI of two-component signal transduction system YycFG
LGFLKIKIIFFILFLLLNIGLLYSEYLNNKSYNNNDIMINGMGGEVKKILAVFTSGGAAYAS